MNQNEEIMPMARLNHCFSWIALFACITLSSSVHSFAQAKSESQDIKNTQTFRMFTVEMSGTKFWLPSTLVVKKGTKVKLQLVTKIPTPNHVHGFKIPDYNIEAVVTDQVSEIEFTADRAGIFPILCHLHAAHIGGQLVVLE